MNAPTELQVLSSGIEGLDQIIEGPCWTDTVALCLNDRKEYGTFLEPLADFLQTHGIPIHYVRFADRPILLSPSCSQHFVAHSFFPLSDLEAAKSNLCQLVGGNGSSTFYVLDSVSELANLANSEEPFIEWVQQLSQEIVHHRAAAYIALERNQVSNRILAGVKDAVSIFLDVRSIDGTVYLQPIRVHRRYSENMFLRYRLIAGRAEPESGVDFADYARTLEKKSNEFLELYAQKRKLEKELQRKTFELSLVNEITSSLLSTMNLEEILFRILIGATAKEGLGFNRAFLLLVNEQERVLEGKTAIGPSSLDEALRIWTDLNTRHLSFPQLLSSFDEDWQNRNIHVNQIVHKIRVPLNDRSHVLIQLVNRMQAEIIDYHAAIPENPSEVLKLLEAQSFAAVPLLFRNRCLGLLLADNLITNKEITSDDLEMLQTLANYASSAIEHARLYEEVRSRIKESERHIHELEAMQDRLMRSKKLSELGELASKMAHEIRTPLVSIGGFANAVLKKESPDSEHYEYLKIIVEEVRRLEAIISDVLAYVSPGIPRTQPSNLRAILDQVLFMMSTSFQNRNIQVSLLTSDDLSDIQVDPDQIKQVFMVILNNAIESMPDGGQLAISLNQHNEFIHISISDTGIGIPEDKLDKVFDAFFTTKSTGSGLGLNIASQIITNHKGSIYVESKVGVGSTFVINLPLTTRKEMVV